MRRAVLYEYVSDGELIITSLSLSLVLHCESDVCGPGVRRLSVTPISRFKKEKYGMVNNGAILRRLLNGITMQLVFFSLQEVKIKSI